MAVERDTVRVSISPEVTDNSCGGCGIAFMCRRDGNFIDIPRPRALNLKPGDRVVIVAAGNMQLRAVIVGFIIPLLLMMGAVPLAINAGIGQNGAAAAALGTAIIYYLLIFVLRKHITKQFQWKICLPSGQP